MAIEKVYIKKVEITINSFDLISSEINYSFKRHSKRRSDWPGILLKLEKRFSVFSKILNYFLKREEIKY